MAAVAPGEEGSANYFPGMNKGCAGPQRCPGRPHQCALGNSILFSRIAQIGVGETPSGRGATTQLCLADAHPLSQPRFMLYNAMLRTRLAEFDGGNTHIISRGTIN